MLCCVSNNVTIWLCICIYLKQPYGLYHNLYEIILRLTEYKVFVVVDKIRLDILNKKLSGK